MKRTSLRLASLAMALFTVLSLAHALAEAGYTPYPTPRTAVSEDSTIYLRDIPAKDTEGAVQLRHMEGKTVSVLGEDATGKYFYIEYEGKKGFVRAKDFELTDKTPAATPGPQRQRQQRTILQRPQDRHIHGQRHIYANLAQYTRKARR